MKEGEKICLHIFYDRVRLEAACIPGCLIDESIGSEAGPMSSMGFSSRPQILSTEGNESPLVSGELPGVG